MEIPHEDRSPVQRLQIGEGQAPFKLESVVRFRAIDGRMNAKYSLFCQDHFRHAGDVFAHLIRVGLPGDHNVKYRVVSRLASALVNGRSFIEAQRSITFLCLHSLNVAYDFRQGYEGMKPTRAVLQRVVMIAWND